MRICKHCKNEFDISDKPKGWMANHTRWCAKNPKRVQYSENLAKSRKAITLESRKKQAEGIKKAHREGKYDHVDRKTFLGKNHSEKTKEILRKKALASPHRRLKKGTIEYKGILLDSSWELVLAKRLDELGIKWVRPEPIPWVDDQGITHNYFSDFYLEDYDLYLDPKNPQAVKVQKKKLDCLLTQYKNIVILESIEECKQFSL